MKKFKIILIFIAGFSLGELVTAWRLEPEPISFLEYLKKYKVELPDELKNSHQAGVKLFTNPAETAKDLEKSFFPNRPQ